MNMNQVRTRLGASFHVHDERWASWFDADAATAQRRRAAELPEGSTELGGGNQRERQESLQAETNTQGGEANYNVVYQSENWQLWDGLGTL